MVTPPRQAKEKLEALDDSLRITDSRALAYAFCLALGTDAKKL
jgi:hypothetical protein